MKDPHVVSLRYRLVPDDTISFENPTPVDREIADAFKIRLADGILIVELLEHYPTPKAARERVEPDLRAWEKSTLHSNNTGRECFS